MLTKKYIMLWEGRSCFLCGLTRFGREGVCTTRLQTQHTFAHDVAYAGLCHAYEPCWDYVALVYCYIVWRMCSAVSLLIHRVLHSSTYKGDPSLFVPFVICKNVGTANAKADQFTA